MYKGIVVVDIPEHCSYCRFRDYEDDCVFQDGHFETWEEQSDGCPIKPLPKKDNEDYFPDEFQDGIKTGWNMCIDMILKGCEEVQNEDN